MSKSRKRRNRRQQKARRKGRRRYDVRMIRDFLDHLLWAIRIDHFEHTTAIGTINPELGEQLAKYWEKYKCALLRVVKTAELPTSEFFQQYRAETAEKRKHEIEFLESLQDLFEEALICAEHPNEIVCRTIGKDGDDQTESDVAGRQED